MHDDREPNITTPRREAHPLGKGETGPSLDELVRRCRGGDREAADILYRRYAGLVRHIIRSSMSSRLRQLYDSTDLQQSLFATVLEDLTEFDYRGEKAFERWLRKATVNKVRYRGRSFMGADGQPRAAALPETPEQGPVAAGPGPAEFVERADELARLDAALDALPRISRDLVLLVTAERITFAEAAVRLQLPNADAARMRYARALRDIAKAWPTT